MTEQEFQPTIRFSRRLGLWQIIIRTLVLMVIIIAYVLLGDVVAAAGGLAPLAYLTTAIILLINVLGYIELAVSSPHRGAAYGQVHNTRTGWLAFITGWLLILAGLTVCALLARGFAIQVTTLLQNTLSVTLPTWPWTVGLITLLATNNALGTRESRRGFMTILILLMIILLGMTVWVLPQVEPANYQADAPRWNEAVTLLMVSFVGIEIVTSLQSEMHRRLQDTPRAMILTPVLTGLVGAALLAVIVGVVGVESIAEAIVPLTLLGAEALNGTGGLVVLIAGAIALALSFNKTLLLTVRQAYVMSKDGYWPGAMRKIFSRFGTPVWTIVLITLATLLLIWLPMAFIAQVAGLLYLLVLMGVNLTMARRPQSETATFKLPFHPWIPGITIAMDVLVISLWGAWHLLAAAGCVGIGTLIYYAYAQQHHIDAQEGLIVFKAPKEERPESAYRVLVPIANPATAENLLHLAGLLATGEDAEVIALQVATVPEQIPLEAGRHQAETSRVLLDLATTRAQEDSFAVQTMTRVAHSVQQGILDTAQEEKVDLILLGWRGYTRSAGASMGPIIDAVIRDATSDVIVAKGNRWENVKKILLPTAGGPHAPIAARLAMAIEKSSGAEVTAIYVQLGRATPQQMQENKERIAKTLDGLEFCQPPKQKVILADSVVEGIIRESEDHDLVLLGASDEGLFDQFVFGSIPQQVAARVPKTAVIVRRYTGATKHLTQRLMRRLSTFLLQLNVEEQLELREELRDSARPGANFFVLIILSCIIASLGLLLNSVAVVIGAMLVAPLMSPIMGFSLGVVVNDVRLIRLSIEAVFKGIALAIFIAIFIGVISPFKELTFEILSRTQPTLLDLAIALASGMAGAYALARKEVSAALPGVAISAALMPPLCAAGLGLALGQPQVAGGALLLFLANIASISLAGSVIFILLGVRPQTWRTKETRQRMWQSLIGFSLLLLVIAIPLSLIMFDIVEDTRTQRVIERTLTEEITAQNGTLVELQYQEETGRLSVIATIRSVERIDQNAVNEVDQALEEALEESVTLQVVNLPVIRSTDQ